MKKAIVILVAVGLLGLLGWQIHAKLNERKDTGPRRRKRSVPVEATSVIRKTMRNVPEFTGTLLPESRFDVAPKVPGKLEKLLVNIGDTVQHGALIAQLDSAEYDQEIAQATAELAVAEANRADMASALEVAQREYDRVKELRQQKVASEAELDQAKARYDAARAKHEVSKAQIQQKQAALKGADVRRSYTQILADWKDGATAASSQPGTAETRAAASSQPGTAETRVVAERFVDRGTMLRANEPIVSIVDLDPVLAVINVIERDFPNIRVGQEATLTTDAYPRRTFTGHVARRAPVLREQTRQARVEIEVPNPDKALAPGMFVRVRIQFAEHPGVQAVPFGAIVPREGNRGVFVVDAAAKKARFVPVETGIVEGPLVEVLSPELSGKVVTLGQHLLEDGADIMLPKEPRQGATGATQPANPEDRP